MKNKAITRRTWLKTATTGVLGATLSSTGITLQGCITQQDNDQNRTNEETNDRKKYFVRSKRIPCIHCLRCMPCAFGLDISEIFRFVNEHSIIAESASGPMLPYPVRGSENDNGEDTKSRMAFRVAYARAIEDLRQADKCTGCNWCVSKCPKRIAIPEEMLTIAKIIYDYY